MSNQMKLPWENIKCDVCGDPAVKVAQDLREIPGNSEYVSKIPLRNWRAGCAAHPVTTRTFWLDGRVTVRS
jgi:hypothetical protein